MFRGPYGVLLTPFTKEGKVDYNAFEEQLDFLLKTDIQGFFACGTTGEFVSLSPQENIELMEFTANRLRGKKQLLAGASDPNPATSVAYLKAAQKFGYDAAMICPPYYFTMKQDDVIRYYKYMADQNIIDLILYKIPMFTNTIELPSFEKLLNEKRIVGMKDSSGNMKQIAHEADIVRRNRPDFALMTGTDDCIVPALLAGCVGSVTAFSVILPEVNARIYELFNAGRITEAQDLNRKALRLLRLADSVMFPSGYKLVYEQRGFSMGHCQVVDEQAIRALRLSMRAELDELFRGIERIR